MSHWIPKNKILILVATILGLSVVLYIFGIFLVKSKINSIKSAYTASESKFVQEERREIINEILKSRSAEIEKLRRFFVAKGDEVVFIEKIESLARENGLLFEIDTISQSTAGTNNKQDIIIKMDIEGGWHNVMTFIKDLETMPFGVAISSIELDAKAKSGWSGFIEFAVFREK